MDKILIQDRKINNGDINEKKCEKEEREKYTANRDNKRKEEK